MGKDTSDLDEFEEGAEGGWPDDQIHVVMDVSDQVESKWEALECHATQFGPDNLFRRVPEDVAKEAISREHFALAWPDPAPGLVLGDLFDGLDAEMSLPKETRRVIAETQRTQRKQK